VFEGLKQSLREALNRASSPTEGRAVLATMRDTLIEAKAGIAALRAGTEATRAQLAAERAELATVQRRGRLAAEVQDAETVRVAAQFERRHAERVEVLEQKLTAQEAELELAERELADMMAELRAASAGLGMSDVAAPPTGAERSTGASAPDADLRRATDRMAHEAAAARQLAELKRRMGR
jgi:hypothetical protein